MERPGMTVHRWCGPCLTCCGFLTALAGCTSPMETRYPTLWYGSPRAEQAAYERHDPLPDSSMGPMTSARPREADIPRADPRKIRQSAVKPWNKTPPGSVPPGSFPPGSATYQPTSYPPPSYQTVQP